jgi:magnesium-protoporphyrin O-methyltransferase
VPSCCDPNGLADMFGAKRAEADARAYRRRGLDRDERRVTTFLEDRGVSGATVLEIGGGVGAIQLDLLRAGAAAARNLEISPHYERSAHELAAESGVADRIDRTVADFAAVAATVLPADAVILHKVVCCYPDMPGLVGPAAERARRWLVLTFPADRWWIRAGVRMVNAAQTLFGARFRIFFHEPREIRAIAERGGLRLVLAERSLFWQYFAMERA